MNFTYGNTCRTRTLLEAFFGGSVIGSGVYVLYGKSAVYVNYSTKLYVPKGTSDYVGRKEPPWKRDLPRHFVRYLSVCVRRKKYYRSRSISVWSSTATNRPPYPAAKQRPTTGESFVCVRLVSFRSSSTTVNLRLARFRFGIPINRTNQPTNNTKQTKER